MTAMRQSALLEVRDLAVRFSGRAGIVDAVSGVSFDLAPGETVALVGESGSGKSTIGLALMGLTSVAPAGSLAGAATLSLKNGRRQDVMELSDREMQAIRGNEVAMIFQEPMSSLNPVHTVGWQIREAIICHQGIAGASGRRFRSRLAQATWNCRCRAMPSCISSSAVRRHAAASDDRHRALLPAELADRRRANHGARCHGPGPDSRAAEAGPGRNRDGHFVHYPQLRRGRGNCAAHDGDVRGQDRRSRSRGRGLPRTSHAIHARPARFPAAAGPRLWRAAAGYPRSGPESIGATAWLRLSSALPSCRSRAL